MKRRRPDPLYDLRPGASPARKDLSYEDFKARFGPRSRPPTVPAPSESPAIQIPGKHKPAAAADAEAREIVASVEAYKDKHGGTLKKTCEVLYRELGHASSDALEKAYGRARKRLGIRTTKRKGK